MIRMEKEGAAAGARDVNPWSGSHSLVTQAVTLGGSRVKGTCTWLLYNLFATSYESIYMSNRKVKPSIFLTYIM